MNMNSDVLAIYSQLLDKYGDPEELWPQWSSQGKDERTRQIVAMGAVLTQRTSWRNAEMALKNLQAADLLSFNKITAVSLDDLTNLVRVAGFYTTKPRRLQELCHFIYSNYVSMTNMLSKETHSLREELLSVYGIGPETADTILLYALDKPSFVIDEYTKRFVNKYQLTELQKYDELKDFFEQHLPADVEPYQNYHILIIADQKGKDGCLMEVVE